MNGDEETFVCIFSHYVHRLLTFGKQFEAKETVLDSIQDLFSNLKLHRMKSKNIKTVPLQGLLPDYNKESQYRSLDSLSPPSSSWMKNIAIDVGIIEGENVKMCRGKLTQAQNQLPGLFYLGNIESIRSLLKRAAINTDDKRTIELKAPLAFEQVGVEKTAFLTGPKQASPYDDFKRLSLDKDPYLLNIPTQELQYIEVGELYADYLRENPKFQKCRKILAEIRTLSLR